MAKKQVKKEELIKILVNDFGYEKEDIKMLTNAKLKSIIEQENKDEQELEAQENVVVAKEARFKDEDEIVIMNGLNGALTHRSGRTGRSWRFRAFGQQDKMPYGELLSIRNANPKAFTEGWIVILNKKVQEEFGLVDTYKNILTPDNIDGIFNKDVSELSVFIDNLPEGMKVTFVSKARELYEEKKLYDMRIIELVESKFGFSLKDNAPLSETV